MTGSVLSSGQAAFILFGCFFLGLFLRIPVAFSLALPVCRSSSSSRDSIP